jgi:hypothetical protein
MDDIRKVMSVMCDNEAHLEHGENADEETVSAARDAVVANLSKTFPKSVMGVKLASILKTGKGKVHKNEKK